MTTSSKTIQAFVGVGCLAVLALSASAQDCAAAKGAAQTGSKDIVQTAIVAGQFKTLVKAVEAAGLTDALLKDKDKLTSILTYHVVPGKVMAADVVKLKEAKTVQGQSVKSATMGGVMMDNAKVVQLDGSATNGVIHVIDTVIMPK